MINFLPAGIFQKVLSSSNVLTVLLHTCSPLLVSLSSALLAVTGILWQWTENIQRRILNIEYCHVLFTIPQECRKFFFYNRSLLSKLSAAVNQVFKFIFHNVSRKRKRKNKISEHSKYYFTDSDIVVHYDLISVIHTFGRDLKWNPHVHAIVSLGGFNKNLEFRKMRYFQGGHFLF